MLSKTLNPDEQLLPVKHESGDLFICDVADAVLKDIIPQMEHPFYSLSKRPETAIRRYEHNGNYVEIIPSVKGLATIYDRLISQGPVQRRRRSGPCSTEVNCKRKSDWRSWLSGHVRYVYVDLKHQPCGCR